MLHAKNLDLHTPILTECRVEQVHTYLVFTYVFTGARTHANTYTPTPLNPFLPKIREFYVSQRTVPAELPTGIFGDASFEA